MSGVWIKWKAITAWPKNIIKSSKTMAWSMHIPPLHNTCKLEESIHTQSNTISNLRTEENIVPKLKISIHNWKKQEMGVIRSIARKTSLATLSLNMLSSTHKICKHSLDAFFYLDSGATDHICNTRDFYSTFESHTQTFTVPGGMARGYR